MDQYATACFDGTLDEAIALREMLEQILILDIIHFDSHVRETIEQALLNRKLQHREYMGDSRFTK